MEASTETDIASEIVKRLRKAASVSSVAAAAILRAGEDISTSSQFDDLMCACRDVVVENTEETVLTSTDAEVPSTTSSPTSADKQKTRGDAHFRAKRFVEAVRCYSSCLDTDPCNVAARLNRVAAELHMGRFENANQDCLVCLATSTCTPKQRTKALFRRAKAQKNLGHPDVALRLLREAEALDPSSEQISELIRTLKIA